LQWQSAYWIVSQFLSPKRHNRGKTQWTIKSFILQSSHIMILNSTKFGGNRTKDLEVSPDRQTERKNNLTRWPWQSIGFQILLRTKYVPSLLKIHWRMLILECSQGCYWRMDGSVTISLRNFVGKGIIKWWQLNIWPKLKVQGT
jgi:hypothetical protein